MSAKFWLQAVRQPRLQRRHADLPKGHAFPEENRITAGFVASEPNSSLPF
jgi:hypothetical protein